MKLYVLCCEQAGERSLQGSKETAFRSCPKRAVLSAGERLLFESPMVDIDARFRQCSNRRETVLCPYDAGSTKQRRMVSRRDRSVRAFQILDLRSSLVMNEPVNSDKVKIGETSFAGEIDTYNEERRDHGCFRIGFPHRP